MDRFFGEFSCRDDVIGAFDVAPSELDGVDVLVASYEFEGYEGAATVIYRRGGSLFEVYASHCSCYGLEGQWSPERVVAIELVRRFGSDDELARAVRDLVGSSSG